MSTVLRPMNTSELLDRTFFLYRKHFIVFVGIVAIIQLVLLLFRLAVIALRPTASIMTTLLLSLLAIAVYLLTLSASQAATIGAVSDVHMGRPAGIGAAFAVVRDNFLEIVLTMIFMGLGVLLGIFLLIVPGIILGIAWSLAIPAIVIENKEPFEAMRRSYELTKGNRFRIFVILLLVTIFAYIISFIIQFPLFFLIGISGLRDPRTIPAWVSVVSQIANFVSISLLLPISTIAISLIYYDQRVRKEGFDLQLMISALKSGQTAPTAPTIS